ncbi:MAG: 1-deoxy-D-xylulose-5-phosphate reductoisomerase [Ruminococcaceae bacterium]|nr:1-deoxy-D-xylulose-5-phosphate reductoisomerase [Oscillospiraceae bacterium]
MPIRTKKTERISIIGSTGSIGTQTLEVAEHLGLKVTALAAGTNITLLAKQIEKFSPQLVSVADEKTAKELENLLGSSKPQIMYGMDGLCAVAADTDADTVVTAVVGMMGLLPTMRAAEKGKTIALANKETLVAGGEFVKNAVKKSGSIILPVDSEHSAVFQCMQGGSENVRRIILTASGGAFYGKKRSELENVTADDALLHPTWKMGKKITVDCATLMNKGFEVIEAMHLFDMPISKVDVTIHRQSIVHSMIEYEDGAVIAQLGTPDMRTAIQYAMTYPQRMEGLNGRLDFTKLSALTFAEHDRENFPCLGYCIEAARMGGIMPATVNGANEVAVDAFLKGQISFAKIADIVAYVLENVENHSISCLEDVLEADANARAVAKSFIK